MKKYYSPLITGVLVGFACWLVDTVIVVSTVNDVSVLGALLTEISVLRLSVRLLVLLAAVLAGGVKSLSLYQQTQAGRGIRARQPEEEELSISENYRRKSPWRSQEGEIEEIVRQERRPKTDFIGKSVSATNRMVWQYAGQLGEQLDLSDDEMQQLQAVCYFHDLGRFFLSEERQVLHAEFSARILEGVEGLELAAAAVRSHHEKYNGSGPLGQQGQDIPLLARIFAVAWVYNALTRSAGAYRLKPAEALEMLYAYSGTALDPELVSLFIGLNGKGRIYVDKKAAVLD